MESNRKPFYKNRRYQVIFGLVVLLIAFRLYLPTLVKNYVNKVLAELPGYYGHVESIDIALIRGAYVINELYLNKIEAETEIPFINLPKTDISIEWKSLFKGEIVSEVLLYEPTVNYVSEDQEGEEAAKGDDWSKALTDLVPIKINHLEMHDGKFSYIVAGSDPAINLDISNLELVADNLRNVEAEPQTLPSPMRLTGTSVGNGQLSIEGELNLIREIPDLDLALALEGVDMTALNDFSSHYASLDFEQGRFDLYSEIAIADGFMTGYIKPMLVDSKLIAKEESFAEKLWEGFVGFFKFALKNQGTNTLASKVPLEGDLNNVETSTWTTIVNVVKNGWIEAFTQAVDEDVSYQDALQRIGGGDNTKSKKEIRQEKREEKQKEKESRGN
ncbi:DUF748 domain-containing protein [Algoriphagus jejuensis]|uniref:DUF748 domain-containing protein n=1 Tax=Algoriphagus jejuensis TaxID=419934 RepID=A0ABN1N2F1_9BACT